MRDFDKLWNYNDPAATELKFREVLKDSSPEKDLSYHLQLLTQIARTYSLRAKFDEAHQLLNEVEKSLPGTNDLAHVRYHLERGRSFNSDEKKKEASEQFEKAKLAAEKLNEDRYTVDAMHMLAIAAPPELSIRLNEEALLFTENSADKSAKGWLGPLYNNLGWGYFDMGEYEKALSVFLRSLKWREDMNQPDKVFIAKWCVAKTLRVLNRIEEALTIQLGLFEEMASTGNPDGYVNEELGELFLLMNEKQKSAFHFEKAWQLLSQDVFMQRFEKPRLDRIKELSVA